jgi:hypothetical protein
VPKGDPGYVNISKHYREDGQGGVKRGGFGKKEVLFVNPNRKELLINGVTLSELKR